MGLLPKEKSISISQDPKNLIIFGLPKTGKTTAVSQLPDALIVDMENGSNYVSGYIVKANKWTDLRDIAKELCTEEHNFKFVILDTITALEDIATELACRLYQNTPMGRAWEYKTGIDILKLPNGSGYLYLREAMQTIISWFEKSGLNIILIAHVKDKIISDNNSEEMSVKAVDLSGKISNILSAKSDAIGFVFRDVENNKVYMNFGSNPSVICCARPEHLNGKKILLTEKLEDGTLVSHWDDIYPSLKDDNA